MRLTKREDGTVVVGDWMLELITYLEFKKYPLNVCIGKTDLA